MTLKTEQMKFRGFDIVHDIRKSYTPVDAICQFKYKDYTISMSTVDRSRYGSINEVKIFDKKGGFLNVDFNTVEEAIDYIDNGNVVVIPQASEQYPFICARTTKESQTLYDAGETGLVIKDWVVIFALPDFKVYNCRWMEDEQMGSYCLIPDIDVSVEKGQVFATFEEAKQAVRKWWIENK